MSGVESGNKSSGALRAFFAIMLPHALHPAIATTQKNIQQSIAIPNIRWTDAKHLHITLRFIPSLHPTDISLILNRVEDVLTHCKQLDLSWQGLTLFPKKECGRIIAYELLLTEPLNDLVHGINEILLSLDYPIADVSFRPHVTIARMKEALIATDMVKINPMPLPSFTASTIHLMASKGDAMTSHYTPLGHVTLE